MAQITGSANEKVIPLKNWLGLHESRDGDTGLKIGEASAMRNFRVTRDGNLQKRPGVIRCTPLEGAKNYTDVICLWSGMIDGAEILISVRRTADGTEWLSVHNGFEAEGTAYSIGNTEHAFVFGFDNRAYILTGSKYYCFDGTAVSEVEGYIPLVAVSVPAEGGGETLEQINKLSAKRRIWFSPASGKRTYTLPEKGIKAVSYVKRFDTGAMMSGYTADLANGTVTFSSDPPAGTNTIEVCYEMSNDFRSEIFAMRYSELYNGSLDTRVFLYGDGTNRAFYSGIDYDGKPRADYFPDLNVITVGESNTPITALIRHYGTMVAFKRNSTWSVQYGEIGLADGTQISAFYVKPINRIVGNIAMGQAQLVLNSPRTMHGSDIYEWHNSSSYSSNLSVDERQAKRISDRVYHTLSAFNLENARAYDNNHTQEYFVWEKGGDTMLVHNYAVDAWYVYTGIRASEMVEHKGRHYIGCTDGHIYELDENAYGDMNGSELKEIDCYWESGSMDFGAEYMRKYSAVTWIAVKPEASTKVSLSVQTDRTTQDGASKSVSTHLFDFGHINFADLVFSVITNPQINRIKLKVKKFVYYKLIIRSSNSDAGATVTDADIRVRYTGYAK